MRYSVLLLFAVAISLTSCRKDFDTIPSSGKLEFSKSTVYLDTVFTNVGSSTYMLKVYNRSNDDITIPSIALAKGNGSKYRIMVDGMTGVDGPDADHIGDGKLFKDVELLAKDSLFVFIEETADIASANPADMLYTDEILFDAGSNLQQVNLVTLIQDAVFLYPERFPDGSYETLPIGDEEVYGFYLSGSELTFTPAKPYVIYGYAAVPPGETLTIMPGARVHFHDQAGIIVANTGSIQVNGGVSADQTVLENEVIFEGDRLEPGFADTPGQWGTIWLTQGSINNTFNHATIKNASVGLLLDNSADVVQIKNTQIYNSANVGILARTGKINGENVVINKAGQFALACTLGGTYDFTHCTFANYWTGSSRQSPAVILDNSINNLDLPAPIDLTANFTSSIIYGPNNLEIGLNKKPTTAMNVTLDYCFIKFNDTGNQFAANPVYTAAFLNNPHNLIGKFQNQNDPKFKNTAKNQLNILAGSSAIGKGKDLTGPLPDILGINRTNPTDIGAYKFVP